MEAVARRILRPLVVLQDNSRVEGAPAGAQPPAGRTTSSRSSVGQDKLRRKTHNVFKVICGTRQVM